MVHEESGHTPTETRQRRGRTHETVGVTRRDGKRDQGRGDRPQTGRTKDTEPKTTGAKKDSMGKTERVRRETLNAPTGERGRKVQGVRRKQEGEASRGTPVPRRSPRPGTKGVLPCPRLRYCGRSVVGVVAREVGQKSLPRWTVVPCQRCRGPTEGVSTVVGVHTPVTVRASRHSLETAESGTTDGDWGRNTEGPDGLKIRVFGVWND